MIVSCDPLWVTNKGATASCWWLETEGFTTTMCVKQGDLHGMETRVGVRASIVALKLL